MFISRMINDPNSRFQPNLMGRTVGIVFHTPKFWNCEGYMQTDEQLHFNQFSRSGNEPVKDSILKMRIASRDYHAKCKWPRRHMSYRGYVYFHGPKKRYSFYYMGNIYRHKLFEVREHHTYTKLF